jgi:hypothetical protein
MVLARWQANIVDEDGEVLPAATVLRGSTFEVVEMD